MEHKVTALKAQKRKHHRVNVYLDGEYAFSLSRIVAAWLRVGQELDDTKIAELQAEDAREAAYQRALRFIGYRMRSEAEVEQNLKKHNLPEELISDVLDRMRRSGLVNDERFAQAWVENRNDYRPRARRALAIELRQKGIADEVIAKTLEETSDDEELANQAAMKYSRKLEHLEWPQFRQRLGGFLARRGFHYEIIAQVVDRVWAERRSKKPPGNNSSF